MTDKVRKQILAIRDTGLTNMFDVVAVQRIANDMGFCELVLYLEENRKEYAHFILTGEA
ncbi:virulence protein [Desulfosporosinus sp. Tol-M]|nr:virulence protein [Desulfosporosinus sp. Tol-M]